MKKKYIDEQRCLLTAQVIHVHESFLYEKRMSVLVSVCLFEPVLNILVKL